ncbi:hypothetical protein D5086_012866 [Populus alba]|uniref:Uncharacterized protein n=1 Tax=Populus alba TaxID=43335 RepID=A0ACC4C3E0_POPAL
MTKSKTKASSLKTIQGDFNLQVPCHGSTSRATRALSRSRLPIQHAINFTSSTPRKKVVLADFVNPSSGARVSFKCRNKPMQRNSSSHSPTTPSACPSSISLSQPTSGKECSTSQPPSGAPPTNDGHTPASRAQGTPLILSIERDKPRRCYSHVLVVVLLDVLGWVAFGSAVSFVASVYALYVWSIVSASSSLVEASCFCLFASYGGHDCFGVAFLVFVGWLFGCSGWLDSAG